jgi:hypothetical protein
VFRRRPRDGATSVDATIARPAGSGGIRNRGETFVVPTNALLQQILDEYGLKHTTDDDGDLTVRWESCNIFFFYYGDKREVLQARLYLNQRFPVEMRPTFTQMLDDWNRTRLFPKAYTVLPDDGMVGICAEQCHDFEAGVTREQLKYTVGVWIDTLLRFAQWVEDQG